MLKVVKGIAAASVLLASTSAALAGAKDPLQIIVSLKDQHLTVYRGDEVITSSNISSGKQNHETPTGIFSILHKNRHHRSNIYSNAPMPFMQRLTWSGIALHASNSVPRHPASHGCVRMPHEFAGQLFRMETNGAHVIIEEDPQAPRRLEHSFLFTPQKTWTVSKNNDPWVNEHITQENVGFVASDHRYPARIFITRRTHKDELRHVQRLLNKLGYDAGDVDGIMGPATWKAVSDFRAANGESADGKVTNDVINTLYETAGETRPANGRLLVRKHTRTVFETEVHLTEPQQPLGSHLLTVSAYNIEAGKTGWMAVTLNDRVQETMHLDSGLQVDPATNRHALAEALDRIQMSKHDREQVSRMLSPGSSITISDNGMSIETGAKGTDFIVLTDPRNDAAKIAGNSAGDAG